MNGISPINFGGEDNQSMLSYVNAIEKRRLQDAQIQNERFKQEVQQKQDLMKLIDPSVLNKNLELEVANSAIAGIRNNVAAYMKKNPGASSVELGEYINAELLQVNEWNNNVKLIKQNIDNQFKDIKDDGITVNNWKNAALTKALYKTNPDGSRSLRGTQELDPNYDYASEVWNSKGESFIDIKKVNDGMIKTIKDAPTSEQDVTVTVGATRDKKGFTRQERVKLPTFATWDEKNNRAVIKTGSDGLLDDGVYAQFVGNKNSSYNAYLNLQAKNSLKEGFVDIKPEQALNPDGSIKNADLFNEAKSRVLLRLGVTGPLSKKYEDDVNKQTIEAIKKGDPLIAVDPSEILNPDGSVKDEERFNKTKKVLLYNYIQENSPVIRDKKDVTQPAKQEIRIFTGSSEKDVPYIDASGNIISKVQADKAAGRPYTQVNTLGGAERNAVLKSARDAMGIQGIGIGDLKLQLDQDGNTGIYTARDIIGQDGETILYNANTYISPIDVQTDISANTSLGTKSKGKAVSQNTGKAITKAEFTAMTLQQRSEFLASGGTYK